MNKAHFVYILASKRNGTLYTGMTSDLLQRIDAHKKKLVEGFTKDYDVSQLVWYEDCESFEQALIREKQIKEWKRQWKLDLIEKSNPDWKDLYADVVNL